MSKKNSVAMSEVDNAKLEMMRIRFRRVLGETVASHLIRNTRKNIGKSVRAMQSNEEKHA